jgi:ATP-binding cassette subfamily B protein
MNSCAANSTQTGASSLLLPGKRNGDKLPMGMRMMGGPVKDARPIKPQTARRVVRSFAPYKKQIAWTVVAVLVSSTLGLLSPFYLRTIVNEGLLGRDLGIVTRYTIYTLLATLGGTGAALAYGYLSVVVGQDIMRDLRNQLYDHLQGMSLRFFTRTRTGEIQSRLISDVGGVQNVVSDTAANVLSNATTVISTLIAMLYMDWRLTLLGVGILPLFALLAAKVGSHARGVRGRVQEQLADLNATMQETLSVSGVLLTKTSGRRGLTLEKFQNENQALTGSQVQQAMIMRYFFNLIGLTFSITPVLVYWLAGYLIVSRGDQHLTLGTIVAFTALQSRLFFPLTGLLNVQVEVTSALALFDRIFEYLDLKQEITDAPEAVALDPVTVRGRGRL